mgnify:CR=1 FL=1
MKAHKYYPEIQLLPWERIILSARDSFRSERRESIDDEWDPLCFSGVCNIRCLFAYISRGSGFCICRIYSDLAHVERYKAVFGHVDKIVELVETGAYIQINAESLIGGIFDKRASFCKKLMKEGLVHFLGTDCHDFRTRRPNMKPAAEVVRKKHADQILYENPRKMLEGKSI